MKKKFILYPAIDIKNGKCVRLLFGNMEKETIYNKNPLDQAKWFIDQGAKWLHIVDLDGAVQGENVNKVIIAKILKNLQNTVKVQIGGGIRTRENIDFWLQNSVDKVILGTLIAQNPNFIDQLDERYEKKIILGADVRKGMISLHGWTKQSNINAIDFIKKFNTSVVSSTIYTDISRDGSLSGIDINQTLNFAKSTPHPVIASGGISSIKEICDLKKSSSSGIKGAIIGRALYEKKFSFSDALDAISGDK